MIRVGDIIRYNDIARPIRNGKQLRMSVDSYGRCAIVLSISRSGNISDVLSPDGIIDQWWVTDDVEIFSLADPAAPLDELSKAQLQWVIDRLVQT
jgi:hypothetical protein